MLALNLEALPAMKSIEGKATAYFCENFTYQAPVNDPAGLRGLLGNNS